AGRGAPRRPGLGRRGAVRSASDVPGGRSSGARRLLAAAALLAGSAGLAAGARGPLAALAPALGLLGAGPALALLAPALALVVGLLARGHADVLRRRGARANDIVWRAPAGWEPRGRPQGGAQ